MLAWMWEKETFSDCWWKKYKLVQRLEVSIDLFQGRKWIYHNQSLLGVYPKDFEFYCSTTRSSISIAAQDL